VIKTNTVVAFAEVKTGSGSVIARSDSGQVMVSAICPSQDRMCVEIAEVLTARHGLQMALDIGYILMQC